MWQKRAFGLLTLFLVLAGPLGLLAVDHAAFHTRCGPADPCAPSDAGHHPSDADGREIPCPVCHFLTTVSLESPPPAPALPGLVSFGVFAQPPAARPAPAPDCTPSRSRAPPFPV